MIVDEIRDAMIAAGEAGHYHVAIELSERHRDLFGVVPCPTCGHELRERCKGVWKGEDLDVCIDCAARGVLGALVPIRPRWLDEAITAAHRAGLRVIEIHGVEDYEGWGAMLFQGPCRWAALHWGYGSCGGCDPFEGDSTEDIISDMRANIVYFESETAAREGLQKGW